MYLRSALWPFLLFLAVFQRNYTSLETQYVMFCFQEYLEILISNDEANSNIF